MRAKVSVAVVIATICFTGRTAAQVKTVVGQLTIGPGGTGNSTWYINNATGVAGPVPDANNNVSGWSLIAATAGVPTQGTHGGTFPSSGNFSWIATPNVGNQFTFALETLLGPFSAVGSFPGGAMSNFNPNLQYRWPFISYEGTYSGPTDSATLTGSTLFDTSLFANAIPPTARFSIALDQVNKQMDLIYTPVPEPGTLGLVAVGLLGVWRASRRRGR